MSEPKIHLKDLYRNYFKLGAACEKISERWPNNEIGNPQKEELILSHFDSITFANELKPAYNMGYASPDATEEYLPFVINPSAKVMLDWVKEHNMSMRGHVMVWHSQCPKEAFCKEYKPITFPTDPEKLKENPHLKYFEKLNPVCFVDRDTMLKRLKSYIFSLVEYMYANGYGKCIYAWDVVNEAIELEDKTPTGLRNSYWYQIIGEDFMYWAFLYARNAVDTLSIKYAPQYGIDTSDEQALSSIKPALFYNDYNEMDEAKKEAIIAALTRETADHGSIISEHLLDGIGMQGHISDTNDIDQYIKALRDYDALADQVHITELDVKCTCSNINAEYYQALFYEKFFRALTEAVKDGVKLTSVTLWGLTDDNSWIRDANPLLFRGDLSPKKAFDALVYVINGGDLGEPEIIRYDLSDRHIDFENMTPVEPPKPGSEHNPSNTSEVGDTSDTSIITPEDAGFKMVGWGHMSLQSRYTRVGKYALANEKRFDKWSFIGYNLSDFIGQTIEISTYVMTSAESIVLKGDFQGNDLEDQTFASKEGEWTYIHMQLSIPSDLHSCTLLFIPQDEKPDVFSPIYIDELSISLIGLQESFENATNIASIRGAGHLPVLQVTDKEAFEGPHSLLVLRQEKDATVKFNISPYIGYCVKISAYVKTLDTTIRMGIDHTPAIELTSVPSTGEWTLVESEYQIPDDARSAEFYIETDGNKEIYIDKIFVRLA